MVLVMVTVFVFLVVDCGGGVVADLGLLACREKPCVAASYCQATTGYCYY